MPQRPSALSLMLCDQVVFEQGTQKPYLLGVFTGVAADTFPTAPQRLDLFAALTDSQGAANRPASGHQSRNLFSKDNGEFSRSAASC